MLEFDSGYPQTVLSYDTSKEFFNELRTATESLVQNSLFLYVAYKLKAVEALAFKEDPTNPHPFLVTEAKLRGISVADLVKVVESKAEQLETTIREVELLRIEFNLRSSKLESYESKLALRDELIAKLRSILSKID